MANNCVIFVSPGKEELRVVFDPDGTPFFCGADLAVIAGYTAPRKAVTLGNQGVNRIESVLRKVPWDNGMRCGSCDHTCFSAENAVKVLCKRPAPYEAIRWLEDVVIPKTQEVGEKIARGYVKYPAQLVEKPYESKKQKKVARKAPEQRVMGKTPSIEKMPLEAIVERLDAIILECALLKREICQTR